MKTVEMRIAVLTTDTTHHLYFIKEISSYFKINGIALEKYGVKPKFDTYHSFEDERDEYEKQELLKGQRNSFDDYAETRTFDSINDNKCVNFIADLKLDVIITFGTGIIRESLLQQCPKGFINLHGGDPENYRGLDTHLWAIYHRDFSQLIVTLHRVTPKLDDGGIIQQVRIKLNNKSELYKLRAYNTKLCVQLTVSALAAFAELKIFVSRSQRKVGRYYSFMPETLKEVCVNNFNSYISKL